jgi:hypothetical protein
MVMVVSDRAVKSRLTLENALPAGDRYTPSATGAIPVERMAIFLDVRRELLPVQERLLGARSVIRDIEVMAASDEEHSTEEAAKLLKPAPKTLFKLAFYLAEYATTRNELLLERGMGLGEYSWIYVIAYYSWLGNEPCRLIESSSNPRVYQDRVAGQVREMIRRHIETTGDDLIEERRLAAWRDDLALFERSPERIPFRQGLPRELLASLQPYRQELLALYAPALDELSLMRTHKNGIKYDHY